MGSKNAKKKNREGERIIGLLSKRRLGAASQNETGISTQYREESSN